MRIMPVVFTVRMMVMMMFATVQMNVRPCRMSLWLNNRCSRVGMGSTETLADQHKRHQE